MNIKEKLVTRTIKDLLDSPEHYARLVLKLQYDLDKLSANYKWLEAEKNLAEINYETSNSEYITEFEVAYKDAKENYFIQVEALNQWYLELKNLPISNGEKKRYRTRI